MLYKLKSWLNNSSYAAVLQCCSAAVLLRRRRNQEEIEVFDAKYNITTAYSSMNEAAKILNIPRSAIVNYFSRNQVKPYKSRYTPPFGPAKKI